MTTETDSPRVQTAKIVVKYIVGFSAGATTKRVLKNNVDPKNKKQEIETYLGAAAIGGLVAEAAEEHVNKTIDSFLDTYRKIRKQISPN